MAANAGDVAKLKSSPEYLRLKKLLSDVEWRLDNLYYIRNAEGARIKFQRNEAQRAFYDEMALRNVLPKSRKLGFSTLIDILICDRCVFRKGHVAGIIDLTLDDAVDKLAIVKFAYDNLPEHLRSANPLVKANQEYLEWANGSSVSVGTSYRGGTPADLHVSEYGKISVNNPEAAREIKTGAISAVPQTGRIFIESTAHGTSGEFADMVKRAKAIQEGGAPLTAIDFKFHFYGWWMKAENRLPNNLVVVSADLKDYFNEIEAKIGRRLDANQRAWYAKEYERLGPDDIKEEAPSTADELFFASQQGAFWREEISRARREGRVGKPVPYDPTRGVNTAWDIGENCTAIWFHQGDGVRNWFIDYWEESGASLQRACGVLDEKRRERGFVYRTHYGPHDLDNRDWAHESKTRKDVAASLGVKFEVVPRVRVKDDAIEAGRRLIGTSWFDAAHCGVGVSRIENYRKRWNKMMGQFTSDPLEDGNDHCFTGDTKILTTQGPKCIKDLPKTGEVLTLCGIKAYRNPRITKRSAQLVEVKFQSGFTVRCTPEHMFLTEGGWKYAKHLQPHGAIRSLSALYANSSMAQFTCSTSGRDIILGEAKSFIAWCGRQLSVKFRRVVTSTTKMTTKVIIHLRILNAFLAKSTSALHGGVVLPPAMFHHLATLHASVPQNGIDRPRGESGTRSMLGNIKVGTTLSVPNGTAPHAGPSLWRLFARGRRKNTALNNAGLERISSVRRLEETADVWCLTVPDSGHFCLENGAVVHNCADALQQLAMGLKPDKLPENRPHRRERPVRTTQWSA